MVMPAFTSMGDLFTNRGFPALPWTGYSDHRIAGSMVPKRGFNGTVDERHKKMAGQNDAFCKSNFQYVLFSTAVFQGVSRLTDLCNCYIVYTLFKNQRRRFMMPTQMIVRIDPDLKAKVNRFAKVEGKSVSEIVRELLKEYVKTRDMDSYIDNLWDRIGGKIALNGFGLKDVERVIRDVRTKN